MTRSYHGMPCWFELGTSDLDGAGAFYGKLLGWELGDSGMPGFDYRLAKANGQMVAGMMSLDDQPPGTPPNWVIYFAVDSADDTARDAVAKGARVLKEPADIPDTGRFAILSDPQGVVFGILQPAPMETEPEAYAFDQRKEGHGNWLELMTPDQEAALDFYTGQFGWTRSTAVPMGEHGTYQLFARDGADIGGMMRSGGEPPPAWFPYFGVNGIDAAIERAKGAGGQLVHGPQEVPGGAFIAWFADPQGAMFAVVGPKSRAA
ncbi:VOC family protein [Paracoccus sp. S-4012]|uniref:VOC family protein n=1 Tax=Paracoccus sp. S-4012 TaxID=2665648 RepID=UPI0012B020A5|nr:VOC family protein [Paracoccus sp. S-4012]MRX49746.1 VOC family protein [Paracoccus sp. S-4012]